MSDCANDECNGVVVSACNKCGWEHVAVAVPRWRSMDSAPTGGERVLLVNSRGVIRVGEQSSNGEWWNEAHNVLLEPAAWMPLPEPPKPGEVET